MPALATQAQLERRIGAATLVQLADDDGDGVADAAVVTDALAEGGDVVVGLLLGSFQSAAAIVTMASFDSALRGASLDITCDLLARRRHHMLTEDGTTPYSAWRKGAEAYLAEVAKAKRRSAAEGAGGVDNTTITTSTNRPANALEWSPTFCSTADNPKGPGGF